MIDLNWITKAWGQGSVEEATLAGVIYARIIHHQHVKSFAYFIFNSKFQRIKSDRCRGMLDGISIVEDYYRNEDELV